MFQVSFGYSVADAGYFDGRSTAFDMRSLVATVDSQECL